MKELQPQSEILIEMDDIRIWLFFFGWIFTFYLSTRAIARSEISRLKDRLVDRIEKNIDWFNTEINKSVELLYLESEIGARATQLDLRFTQINHYAKCEILELDWLTPLRDFNLFSQAEKKEITRDFQGLAYDLIEKIELSYDCHFYKSSYFNRLIKRNKYLLLGVFIGLFAMYIFILLLQTAY